MPTLSIEFSVRPPGEVARRPGIRQGRDGFARRPMLARCRLFCPKGYMRPGLHVLICAFVLASGAPYAQTREDVLRCRSISDDTRRLACYDAVELTGNPRRKYEILDLTELKTFALTYRGDLVEVIGWIKPAEDNLLFLGVDQNDPKPLPIDFETIPRRDREAFLSACGAACEATVQGRVGPVNFTTGLVADTLIAR
jgi:hypothetical protein